MFHLCQMNFASYDESTVRGLGLIIYNIIFLLLLI